MVAASGLIAPGQERQVLVDLDPGTYEISCRIVVETDEGELIDHYEQGMVTRIAVAP